MKLILTLLILLLGVGIVYAFHPLDDIRIGPLDIQWKTSFGHYIVEFAPINERPFAIGLREDGVVVWKYIDNE